MITQGAQVEPVQVEPARFYTTKRQSDFESFVMR